MITIKRLKEGFFTFNTSYEKAHFTDLVKVKAT